jgi:hypothetical protein
LVASYKVGDEKTTNYFKPFYLSLVAGVPLSQKAAQKAVCQNLVSRTGEGHHGFRAGNVPAGQVVLYATEGFGSICIKKIFLFVE